ncbi:hypothetical protein HOP50_20g86600 [Chloropicon primus]|uniref:Uncharacterized protein n=1 Tax=Chloropicon primus TaxID=1764295 RepID=A0A5B8MZZ2_9CHLO|nr:hypothetical protein A3770_20p86110 [Chloropicon primus]UPR05310.1 hypothetical protein HOP50_20g86600 [Chloropicon primus]|eukprot:QDZ26093.1 hypothetical protein A3770_20p86110 [Chloropicon primus]
MLSSRIQPEKINKITSKVKFAEPKPSANPLRTVKKKKKAKSAKIAPDPGKGRKPVGTSKADAGRRNPNQIKKASRQLLIACAQLSSMLLLLFMHAILLIWASAVVVSVYFKVEAQGDFVSVNEALEVYGQAHGPNPYSLLEQGVTPQAHIRIASHTTESTDKADEILSFGTYMEDNFHTRALLRTTSAGSLEMIQSSLLVKRGPVDDSSPTDVLLDVDGPVRFGSKTLAPKIADPKRRRLLQDGEAEATKLAEAC